MRLLTIAVLLASALFGMPVFAAAQNPSTKALTFTDISGMFPLVPLAVSKSTVVGYMCCQSDAVYDQFLVGFAQTRSSLNYPSLGLFGRPLAGSASPAASMPLELLLAACADYKKPAVRRLSGSMHLPQITHHLMDIP